LIPFNENKIRKLRGDAVHEINMTETNMTAMFIIWPSQGIPAASASCRIMYKSTRGN